MEDQSDRHGIDLGPQDAPGSLSDLIECYLKDMNGKLNQSKLGCLRVIKDLPFRDTVAGLLEVDPVPLHCHHV